MVERNVEMNSCRGHDTECRGREEGNERRRSIWKMWPGVVVAVAFRQQMWYPLTPKLPCVLKLSLASPLQMRLNGPKNKIHRVTFACWSTTCVFPSISEYLLLISQKIECLDSQPRLASDRDNLWSCILNKLYKLLSPNFIDDKRHSICATNNGLNKCDRHNNLTVFISFIAAVAAVVGVMRQWKTMGYARCKRKKIEIKNGIINNWREGTWKKAF